MAFCIFLLIDKVQNIVVFEMLSVFVFLLFFAAYSIPRNIDLYARFAIYHLAISISFVISKAVVSGSLFFFKNEAIYKPKSMFFVIMIAFETLFLLVVLAYQCLKKTQSGTKNQNQSIELMPTQLYDYGRISNYLKFSSVIGLNSAWGTGKTTIINHLEENESDNYYFININLLSLNIDDLKLTIIESLSDLLRRKRIFSYSSDRLITLLSKTDVFGKISSILFKDTNTFEDTLKEFKKDIDKLDKPIVIVYEDLDRIKESDTIKSVLDISNYLLTDRIKVIYQYDETRLLEVSDELNYAFLEKYIPCSVELTVLSLRETIEYLMRTHKHSVEWKELLSESDFSVLWKQIDLSSGLAAVFGGKISLNCVGFPAPACVEIRSVEQFIEEICMILKAGPFLSNKKKVLIIVMYLKHFMHDYYMDLQINVSPLRSMLFVDMFGNEKVSLTKIMGDEKNNRDQSNTDKTDNTKKAAEFLNYCYQGEQVNIYNMCFLMALGYVLNDYITDFRQPVTNGFIRKETVLEQNRVIDNVIWCILQAGFSEKTDYQQLVDRMDKEIFNSPEDDRIEAFRSLIDDYYYERISDKKGVGGVFLFGQKCWQTLFLTFGLAQASEKQWLDLIDFLSLKGDIDCISVELIESLLYVKITQKIFLKVLLFFNSLRVVGNMNGEDSYREFLHSYLSAFALLGIMDMEDLWKISFDDTKYFVPSAKDELPEIRGKLISLMERFESMPDIINYLETLVDFIDKNMEILGQDRIIHRNKIRFKSEYGGIIYKNKDVFDQLKKLHDSNSEDFAKQAEEAFRDKNITLYELNKIVEGMQ